MINYIEQLKCQSLEYLDIRSAIETDPAPLDFVLPGLLAGTVGGIVAAGGVGKTMAGLELSVLVASGFDLLGIVPPDRPIPQGRVTYLSAEDPSLILSHRMHAIGARLPSMARDALYERLCIVPLVGLGVDIENIVWWDRISDVAKDSRLIIIDTLRKFHKRDENNGGEMADLLGKFESLCRGTGTTVLFLHHVSKAGALAGGESQQASRGSTVLTDNIRWQANLFGMAFDVASKAGIDRVEARRRICFSVSKQNYGPPVPEVWLRREHGGVLAPVPEASARSSDAYQQASQSGRQEKEVSHDWK